MRQDHDPHQAPATDRDPGMAAATHFGIVTVFNRGRHKKYFKASRLIRRGRKKGQYELTLTSGRKVRVTPQAVTRWPTFTDAAGGEPCSTGDRQGASG